MPGCISAVFNPPFVMQFAAKFGAAFGKVLFATDAEAAAPAAADLEKALQWLEGEASAEGPYLLGKEFSLVSEKLLQEALKPLHLNHKY